MTSALCRSQFVQQPCARRGMRPRSIIYHSWRSPLNVRNEFICSKKHPSVPHTERNLHNGMTSIKTPFPWAELLRQSLIGAIEGMETSNISKVRISNAIAFSFVLRREAMEEFPILISDLYAHILASHLRANRGEKCSHLFILAIKSNEAWNTTLKAGSSALNSGIDFRGWNRMFIQHPTPVKFSMKNRGLVHLR